MADTIILKHKLRRPDTHAWVQTDYLQKNDSGTATVYQNGKLADSNAVDTDNIVDGAIKTNKINDKAITTDKIDNGAVTTDKISKKFETINKVDLKITDKEEIKELE